MSEHTDKYEIVSLLDASAYDNSGHKLGAVEGVFLNDDTGLPTFVEVHHGLFGRHSSLVPLRGAKLEAHKLHLGFSKDAIKDAPDIDPESGLSTLEQDEIFAHYGVTDASDATYFHPELPELPDGAEVGIRDETTGVSLPGDHFAFQGQQAEQPRDAKTRERDAADSMAESERIRLRRHSGR
ncbi:PRC-barrel domain protein [Corynebacterium efficiens YS-314]|uniref:PRC-barrel domain-containing protein n=1 Tax=Corynebacterium efficiens (strain DSM 44549 / YS-314 / AJ 12310 / JCM 11189 / NBRC 100395) TaxID=196164 RepID=Q8FNN6_COREF|nr:PRC-barrel domain-containing protein [Corynebacterium efficiens]EEW49229.1 PRC-barrel domain protein [Corynebacterium efficiens YS-314]BAC18918.1 conserved hypothetical protein [Corynebacterium efficiens YS-314]